MKLTIVGGGSTYTPELIDGFAKLHDVLPIEELWLVDPDPYRLEMVSAISRRMFDREGHTGKITTTSDLVAGVSDADVVLIQLRIGGQAARQGDETWPHEACCIGQETTGPGGFAKALRTVPVVLKVADAVREHAKPDAWIIDFTNPVGIVTRGLLEAGHRAVGLCNAAIGYQRQFAKLLEVDYQRVHLQHIGLNHLTWERGIIVGGRDILPELLSERLAEVAEEVGQPASLLTLLGMVPSSYLRYYYEHDEMLKKQLESPTRAEQVMEVEKTLLGLYADPSVNTKPEALKKRGGAFYSEAAVDLITSLIGNRGDTQVVNLRNNGSLPFLPDDHVIEVPATIGSDGVHALAIDPLPADLAGLIGHVAGYERLALDAAVNGGRDRVLRAMLAHPLVGQYQRAEKLTDLLIVENSSYLPWAK